MLPSPAELTYFAEIAESQNLSRASKKLGVSQPTLSLAIKRLETTLGTHLIVRHKQGVTITPAGEKLLAQVKPLLQHWENTKSQVKDSHHEVQGRVTIGCRSAAVFLMKGILVKLMQEYPKLEISLKFLNPSDITENVINSSIDIGIATNPQQHQDLVIYKFDTINLGFWVGPGNNNLQDIHSGDAVILCEPNVPQVQLLIKELEKLNLKFARVITANSLEVVAQFAMDGLGIAIMPNCIGEIMYADKLTPVKNMPTRTDDICMIYRYENRNVQAVKTIVTTLKDATMHKNLI